MFGLKKKKNTAMYQIKGIDRDTWRMFAAKCKLEGITIKEKLIEFIENSIR
tara:strand:- start:2343 stop:2495 length:153 start_codon:yes stop_codon:yes gene_type:complete